ncbi:unnamed protein product [Phytophthora fragariaefolia]|uniref:Unnamed protein product n=1 Tax=Phytophthora fragariaefolia TaxID=1490495 RepID=A0A9W6Y7T2_9STRA|nr:unnamed protein product [Phytophthora fragariaefolia]
MNCNTQLLAEAVRQQCPPDSSEKRAQQKESGTILLGGEESEQGVVWSAHTPCGSMTDSREDHEMDVLRDDGRMSNSAVGSHMDIQDDSSEVDAQDDSGEMDAQDDSGGVDGQGDTGIDTCGRTKQRSKQRR